MVIYINNPNSDQFGNSKENIFIAFNHANEFIGSAYVYPAINHYQVHETPLVIYLSVSLNNDIKDNKNEIKQALFDKVFHRAKEVRNAHPNLKTRIYTSLDEDEEAMKFYLKNGFDEDYSVILEVDIPKNFIYNVPECIHLTTWSVHDASQITIYKDIHDAIFITPLDVNHLESKCMNLHFKNIYFKIKDEIQGGCTFFYKDGYGYIETIFVMPKAQGMGISKIILSYIHAYFLSNGIHKIQLEVWLQNKKAVSLYTAFGYSQIMKKTMFPGVTL